MPTKIEEVEFALRQGDAKALMTALGWQHADVGIEGAAWHAWGWAGTRPPARLVALSPGCRVVEVVGAMDRAMVLAVDRHAPLETVIWLFVDEAELTVAFATRGPSKRRVRTFVIDRENPDPLGLDRLARLCRSEFARTELDPAAATRAHFEEVFDQEELTRAFFAGFRDALRQMSESVQAGPAPPEDRWHCALVVLLRLVFVYFLQREELLDGDRRYLVRRLRGLPSGAQFYAEVLRPLFFGVLNTPLELRDDVASRLGEIPFLNGGLFEPTPLEREYPQMFWSNDVLTGVIEGLFESFHLTAVAATNEDEACVVDPEMLGKVFEGLMFGDDRRNSGAFYTPRDVVRSMVDRALDDYMADREEEGVDADAALMEVTVLDPAVGTGAFLLEALASLRDRRRAAGLADDYAALRRLVHDHLFGVDRNRTAVRLCELRVWLVMLSAMRHESGALAPLPNLSHRIVAGDSLLDGIDLVRRRAGGVHPSAMFEVMRIEARLRRTQQEFLESHGQAKHSLRKELEDLERALDRQLLAGRRTAIEARLAPLLAVEASRDLFGDVMATANQQQLIESLQDQLRMIEQRARAAQNESGSAPGFGYETRFGAAAREGFDVIVTNPPWVRAQRVDRETRVALATRYQTASGQLWAGARELGIHAPYGSQPDLAALFVERALELLRPGGRLAALIPAKLFRALHAAPMRRLLEGHSVEMIEDHSDATRQLFDATVYPGVLHVRKARPSESPTRVRVWRGSECVEFRRDASRLGLRGAAGEPWMLAPDGVLDVLQRVDRASLMLGELDELAPRRGIFTGANDVFVRPRGGFAAEFGRRVAPFVRPMLRGSGLGEEPTHEVLWCYADGAVLPSIPSWLEAYFEHHRSALIARSDHRAGEPLWTVFRVREDTDASKVAWRDMSVFLEPVLIGAGAVASNTVYYVPFADAADAAGFARWMSSLPVRASAYCLAERARGGWRRHFAWVVRMLPVPRNLTRWAEFDARQYFGLSPAEERVLANFLEPEREAA